MNDSLSYQNICALHVAWYRLHGHYPNNRIMKDGDGIEYVIGDWSWERKYPLIFEQIDNVLSKVIFSD